MHNIQIEGDLLVLILFQKVQVQMQEEGDVPVRKEHYIGKE